VVLPTLAGVVIGIFMIRFVFALFTLLTLFSLYATYTGVGLQGVDGSSRHRSSGTIITSTRGGSYGHWGGGGGGYSYGK